MRRLLLLAMSFCIGCTGTPSEPEVALIQTLTLLREDEGSTSMGWDLDGIVSDDLDPSGCFISDLSHPDGTPGIDNAFGGLLPALEATQGAALGALIQRAVDSGELLLLLELANLGDQCLDFNVVRGAGAPALGGHGKILPGQTYDVNPDQPGFAGPCAATDNGTVVRLDDFTMRLPLKIFDESIDLTLLDGRFEMHRRDDGSYRGIFAGGVTTAEIRANMASLDGIGEEVPLLIETAMDNRADLEPDANGFCSRISVGFTFEAVSAYIFEE